jgi:hypothetical protein
MAFFFIVIFPGPSESEIRQHLSLEEEADEVASKKIDSTVDFTETKYLLYGLDLEEQQYVFPISYFAAELIPCLGGNCKPSSCQ